MVICYGYNCKSYVRTSRNYQATENKDIKSNITKIHILWNSFMQGEAQGS